MSLLRLCIQTAINSEGKQNLKAASEEAALKATKGTTGSLLQKKEKKNLVPLSEFSGSLWHFEPPPPLVVFERVCGAAAPGHAEDSSGWVRVLLSAHRRRTPISTEVTRPLRTAADLTLLPSPLNGCRGHLVL